MKKWLALLLSCLLFAPGFSLAAAMIADGQLVFAGANYACYTSADLGGAVTKMSAKARFFGGGACALIATPNRPESVSAITDCSVHVVFDAHGYFIGFCENGTLTDVKTGEYTLDLTGSKTYSFGWSISGSTLTLRLPGGGTAKYKGDRVKTCGGPYAVWEHYMTPADSVLGTGPVFTEISGVGKTALEDDFERADGEPLAAPSGQAYICFSN